MMENILDCILDEQFLQRFWSKVEISDADSCWVWKGAISSSGYGSISINRKVYSAHRISYLLRYGGPIDGKLVLHTCDNPFCVNLNHLYLGTYLDNVRDMRNRGRQAVGERNGRSKLTSEEVIQIRNIYVEGNNSYRKIADQFGISARHIGNIVKGVYWKLPRAD
jgi:hypothetical protein